MMDGWGNGSAWTVPEKAENEMMSHSDGIEKTRQREASVLRYKEKRQNRLFAKRIRYEVRKVNAEKRPRIKVHIIFILPNHSYVLIKLLHLVETFKN